MKRLILTLAVLLVAGVSFQVGAHSFLIRSEPGEGAVAFWPPAGGQGAADRHEIRLWFTETIEPKFSFVEVRDPNGARADVPESLELERDDSAAVVAVRPGAMGTYEVSYRVLSAVDGHIASDAFSFVLGEAHPGSGSDLAGLPAELHMSVPAELDASEIQVTLLKDGVTLLEESAPFHLDGERRTASIPLPASGNGAYEVRWELKTAQGRKFGQYTFSVTGG